MPLDSKIPLDIKICNEIASSYLDEKISDLSTVKKAVSDTFYNGTHSTYTIRDWLAGGSTNNFAFGYLPRSRYANFSQFIDNVCLQAPPEKASEIIKELAKVKDLDRIRELVQANHHYLSPKCYYDLLVDLGTEFSEDPINKYNEDKRKAETESQRLSKIMCVGYALCQGFIEMMGITGFHFIAVLSAPVLASVMVAVFIIAVYINFSFGREDTTKLILRWKMGNLFKREIKLEEEKMQLPEDFTPWEKRTVKFFAVFSISAAFCGFVLGVLSMQVYLPVLAACLASLFLLVPTSLIFTGMVYKYIDNNGLDGIKEYFETRFIDNWPNHKLKVLFEAVKLIFSIFISILVCCATFLMLHGKSMLLLSKPALQTVAPYISSLAAGITAGVKALFSVSKIGELLDLARDYLFQDKSSEAASAEHENQPKIDPTTAKIFQGLKIKARIISGVENVKTFFAVAGHATSEAGLVWGVLGSNPDITFVAKCADTGAKFFYSGATTGRPFFGNHNKSTSYCEPKLLRGPKVKLS